MFGRSQSNGLKLILRENAYTFSSPEDFAFALSGRAGVPGSRVGSLVEMSDEALRREAEAIRQVEQTFNAALDGSLHDVTSISAFLKEIDLALISHDHDWRTIISALNAMEEPHESYKQVALVKYVQYLAARRQTVTAIYATRRHAKSDGNGGTESKLRETSIFDVAELADEHEGLFRRIPKGETVEIGLTMDSSVAVVLAKHVCHLDNDGKPFFVDDAERVTRLRRGKNIVGRDASCDVLINSAYRDVSRKHLILEVTDDTTLRLTDISSHGTSVDPRLLDSTSI